VDWRTAGKGRQGDESPARGRAAQDVQQLPPAEKTEDQERESKGQVMNQSELRACQSRLFKMRARLMREVGMIEEELREDVLAPGDPSPISSHPADEDIEGFDEQVALAQNEEQLLEEVEAALERIEAGSYGTCEVCGREISKQRLHALPHAARCIDCAQKAEH
jgi:RNA polymerase-binding protein DksA